MRKVLSAILAFSLAAATPSLVPLLFAGDPDCSTGECLLNSEQAILFYPLSVAIGAVVGIPAFLAIRLDRRLFWLRLTLTGFAIGTAGFLLAWFGTLNGNQLSLIWIVPLGILSALVFGAVYRLASGRQLS